MIYTANDYCKLFLICNKKISETTFRRRLNAGIFPPNTECKKTARGWMIYVNEKKS